MVNLGRDLESGLPTGVSKKTGHLPTGAMSWLGLYPQRQVALSRQSAALSRQSAKPGS